MKQFCKEVIEFLTSEYSDAYSFSIEYRQTLPTFYHAELTVRCDSTFCLKICDNMMEWLYRLYHEGTYIAERGQFLWQKELIDIIEGS